MSDQRLHPDVTPPRRASVEVLRAEAADERSVLVDERLRAGQDPWDFMEELPSIDEIVVMTIRADYIAARGGHEPSADQDRLVFSAIARAYPALAEAVARLVSPERASRRWRVVV